MKFKETYTPSGYEWRFESAGKVPPNAVVTGYDSIETLYIGRGYCGEALLPGKVQFSSGCCYVTWDGTVHSLRHYEVLCTKLSQPIWQKPTSGNIPAGSIQGGVTENGEILYIGRKIHNGCMIPGKIQPSQSSLCIVYEGKEYVYPTYEVLTAMK